MTSTDSTVWISGGWSRPGRSLLLFDGAAEALIAAMLVLLTFADDDSETWQRPGWLSTVVVLTVAVVFAVTAVVFVVAARNMAARRVLRPTFVLVPLGVANMMVAIAVVAWAAVDDAVGEPLTVAVVSIGVGVAVMGLLEVVVGLGRRGGKSP